jgi:two-component system sensor histidine kinase DegS
MDNNETVLKEFDGLIWNMRTLVLSSKDEFESYYQAMQDETMHVTSQLETLAQEKLDHQLFVNELVEKADQSIIDLREFNPDNDDFLLQDVKAAYERNTDIQVRLAVARQQERYLQNNYNKLEDKLKDLQGKREITGILASQMGSIVGEFSRVLEIEHKIQGLVQSQNFGFRIITAQEEERRRVAREIHDGPAQAMANVIFLAEVCEKLIEIDTERAKRELYELRQQVFDCLKETRRIIFDLRPMVLDDLGLIPAVKRIADNLKERTEITTSVKLSGAHTKPLESHIEVSLFRVVQESLTNIEKHAKASEVQILMDFQPDHVTITVKDNGEGFVLKKNDNDTDSESFGLLGMRERVSLLHGEFDIRSQPGEGTEITVKIPLVTNEKKRLA